MQFSRYVCRHSISQLTPITKQLADPQALSLNLKSRNVKSINLQAMLSKWKLWIEKDFKLNQLKSQKSKLTASIKKDRTENLMQQSKDLKNLILKEESEKTKIEQELVEDLSQVPNTTHPHSPVGNESAAQTILIHGSPRISCGNDPLRDHMELGEKHDLIDMHRGGKVSANSFYFLKNDGALLELALIRYAMDICIKHGFSPVLTPDVIRYDLVDSCGFKPRSVDPQTYFVSHSQKDNVQMCLAATAEFPLAGMHADETLQKDVLPKKSVGLGRAFRAEGLAGATNRGLYRVHQFSKVEMFALSTPEESEDMFYEIVAIQKEIVTGLDLCFRILNMPTEELGASAYQKIDIEAWMPGRKSWGEISSASNCTDFQSCRLNIRYLNHDKSIASPTRLVHTLNGTAAAIPRLIIALLETHQNALGDIWVPVALRPYFKGSNVPYIRKKN